MPARRIAQSSTQIDLALSAAIVLTTAVCIWLPAATTRWMVAVVPVALTLLLWLRQSQTADSLGLKFASFILSFQRWSVLWILTAALFLFFGRHILLHLSVLVSGVFYFAWCVLQQVLYQSIVCDVLRKAVKSPWAAAFVSGLVFALLHAPNPVLMPGTFLWGIFSCLLFKNCRTVLGLALIQVMLSSMLMWSTPMKVNHAFRVGAAYYAMAATR